MRNIKGELMRLGKKPPVLDTRTLKLGKYLKAAKLPVPPLPQPPAETSWITKLVAAEPIQMFLNDELGDCVEAAAGHMIQQWNFYAGHPAQPTDADILHAYESSAGYVPGDPQTDQGTAMLPFLRYWQKNGVGGHKILAYTTVNYLDLPEVQLAIQLFGNVMTGIALPFSAQGKDDWTVPDGGIYSENGQPGGWGGHCIPIVAGSPITKTCETWGIGEFKMSNNFFSDYVDEAYAVLSSEWLETGNVNPDLISLDELESDLNDLGVLWKRIVTRK